MRLIEGSIDDVPPGLLQWGAGQEGVTHVPPSTLSELLKNIPMSMARHSLAHNSYLDATTERSVHLVLILFANEFQILDPRLILDRGS